MIDLHCHLLPGIDDGAQTMDDALQLCRHAVASGIRKAVATPHIQPGVYDNTQQSIGAAFYLLKRALLRESIPLELSWAAEVRIGPELLDMAAANQIPMLGRYAEADLMLMELPHGNIPPGSDKLVEWLRARGIVVMIAHPERNKAVIRDLSRIQPFVELGCPLQVTAGSVSGQFGPQVQRRAIEILEQGWATVLASDAHNLRYRPPELEAGRRAAAEVVGEEASWALVRDHPAKISASHFTQALDNSSVNRV